MDLFLSTEFLYNEQEFPILKNPHPRSMLSTFQGRYAEAEPFYARAQAILEKSLGTEHLNVASALNNRGTLLEEQVGIELS